MKEFASWTPLGYVNKIQLLPRSLGTEFVWSKDLLPAFGRENNFTFAMGLFCKPENMDHLSNSGKPLLREWEVSRFLIDYGNK